MTYYQALPKVLRDELARAPRGHADKVLPPHVRELIAEAALTLGTRNKGPVLTYVTRRLRHSLGYADFPTPPDMPAGEAAWLDSRIAAATADLKTRLGADQAGHGARVNANPGGYTPPDNVLPTRG